MLDRYAGDADGLMGRHYRSPQPRGRSGVGSGSSTLNGVLVHNSEIIQKAAEQKGFFLADRADTTYRPPHATYLPQQPWQGPSQSECAMRW